MGSSNRAMGCLRRASRSLSAAVLVLGFACVGGRPAFAIECMRAKTEVENAICASNLLYELDTALNASYQGAFYSDIGDGARSWMRSSQRTWLKKRNACKNDECLLKLYVARVDELCELPVISGVHFNCEMSDTILDRHGRRPVMIDAKPEGASK